MCNVIDSWWQDGSCYLNLKSGHSPTRAIIIISNILLVMGLRRYQVSFDKVIYIRLQGVSKKRFGKFARAVKRKL